jgi:RNA polymerase sigma factor (sigma-70 family)
VEASALKHVGVDGLRGPTPLLRLQSDERLVALTRRGNQAAYEALVARYQARLLAFCRHMLGSREDAEDVLQEVFAAAYNAMVADERPLNVRPWLYRIARNRSLNHLRRVQAIGVDSMDVHLSENGASTADKVHRREEFRLLVQDVQGLAETQRTALLLREIDALSYEQIAEAMETTVPSVKSLLVRARVSLAESAEARHLTCDEVRDELGEVAEGLQRTTPPVRRHLRTCDRCSAFRKELRRTNRALAAVFPVGPLLLVKKLLLANLGTTASAGGSAAAAAGAGAASAGAGSALSAGVGAMASKAAAGLAAAAIVTAGAVEVDHAAKRRPVAHRASAPAVATATLPATPHVVASQPQPIADAAPVHHRAAPVKRAEKDATDKPAAKTDAKANAKPATPATTPAIAAPQQGSATVTLPDQQTADAPAPAVADDQTTAPPPAPADNAPADPTTSTQPPAADPPAPPPAGDTTTQPAPPAADTTTQPAPPADSADQQPAPPSTP